jgi:ribose/xylose/arabinose/galactoside ABC-type transport system permease subunit
MSARWRALQVGVSGRMVRSRGLHLLIALGLFAILLLIKDPHYFTIDNLKVVGLNGSSEAIGAVGTAFLMIAGGIDLSISSIFVAAGFGAAALATHVPAPVAIIGGLLIACGVGWLNGVAVWRIRVSPLIVTLGSLTLIGGVVTVLSSGTDVLVTKQAFLDFGQGSPLGVPTMIWAAVIIAVLAHIVLAHTTIGSHIYALGGNREASELAGVRVRRLLLGLFVFAAVTAGLAGIMTVARFGVADITYGTNYNLDVITAVILGGVAFTGGEGSIGGAMLGVIFLQVVQSGIIALGVNQYYADVVSGGALILSVGLEQLTQERNDRLRRSLAIAEMLALEAEREAREAAGSPPLEPATQTAQPGGGTRS